MLQNGKIPASIAHRYFAIDTNHGSVSSATIYELISLWSAERNPNTMPIPLRSILGSHAGAAPDLPAVREAFGPAALSVGTGLYAPRLVLRG